MNVKDLEKIFLHLIPYISDRWWPSASTTDWLPNIVRRSCDRGQRIIRPLTTDHATIDDLLCNLWRPIMQPSPTMDIVQSPLTNLAIVDNWPSWSSMINRYGCQWLATLDQPQPMVGCLWLSTNVVDWATMLIGHWRLFSFLHFSFFLLFSWIFLVAFPFFNFSFLALKHLYWNNNDVD